MSNIKLDIPDITVVVEKGNEYLSVVNPSEIYQVLVNTGDNYNVVVDDPATITVNGSGSYLTVADYASTASYALIAQSLAAGGSIVYDTISASNAYFGNLTVSQSITANFFSGSFSGDGSQLTGIGVSGGTNKYIPLWTGTSTLSSSLLFQTGSSLLLGSTIHHTPEAPDKFGVYAGITDSYNLISAHGETDSYLQLNVRNFSTGAFASSDIVATTDSGTEVYGYINMGINGTGYLGGGDSIGTADDAYLYMAGDGDLLIGNTSVDRRVILFSGAGSAISNARVFIDTQGFVGINTSSPMSGAPEALAVQAIPESFNVINARASTNSYAQFNIKNDSNGADASSDIVATADNGTETANYINMGINSSQFAGLIGGPNDAYLYSTGSMLHIGNATPDQHVMFFVGSSNVEESRKLTLEANNLHTLTGSLDISGSISTLSNIINNLTASFAMTASYVSGAASSWETISNKPSGLVSSSIQINTGSFSGSFTGLLIGTSSWASNTISSSYAPTILPAGTVSSSTQVDYNSIQNQPTTIPTASFVLNAVSASFVSTASFIEYINVVNKPPLVSSSAQINTGSFTGSFVGVLIGTSSWANNAISASYVLPTGLPLGTISSSTQVNYEQLQNIPAGIVSSSTQINTGSLFGTASYSQTASYVEYTNIGNKPTLLSSSLQINTGSFSGSFVGILLGTSSWAVSASYAPTILPMGTVSSSTQIDYTAIQNKPTTIPTASYVLNAVSASFASTASLVEYANVVNIPTLVSSSAQINTGSFTGSLVGVLIGTSSWAISSSYVLPSGLPFGVISSSTQLPSGIVSSSIQINTGSFSGSFVGTLIGTSSWAISSSYIEYTNVVNKPTLVSSSLQINTGSFTGSFIGTHSGSTFGTASWAVSASYVLPSGLPAGIVSSSTQLPSGTVSSSVQINTGSFSGSFTGTLIGTSSWAISSSYVLPTGLPIGLISSSTQLPSGIVSSSLQINTGSFSGSFVGVLIGTSSWASNAISSSFATTASAATSITFIPPTASFATTASYVALPSGLVSSSQQINTGSFTGSFIGTHSGSLFGTASWAISASYVLPTGLPSGVVSSSTQINTGSFSGSFIGELIGTSSWANNATTASAATSITFTPATASYALTSSFIDGGFY